MRHWRHVTRLGSLRTALDREAFELPHNYCPADYPATYHLPALATSTLVKVQIPSLECPFFERAAQQADAESEGMYHIRENPRQWWRRAKITWLGQLAVRRHYRLSRLEMLWLVCVDSPKIPQLKRSRDIAKSLFLFEQATLTELANSPNIQHSRVRRLYEALRIGNPVINVPDLAQAAARWAALTKPSLDQPAGTADQQMREHYGITVADFRGISRNSPRTPATSWPRANAAALAKAIRAGVA